jgi:hypothetical protein
MDTMQHGAVPGLASEALFAHVYGCVCLTAVRVSKRSLSLGTERAMAGPVSQCLCACMRARGQQLAGARKCNAAQAGHRHNRACKEREEGHALKEGLRALSS